MSHSSVPGTGSSLSVLGSRETAALAAVAERAAAQMAAENFPVALRVLPRAVSADLAALYRYARFVDDVGDGAVKGAPAVSAEQRLAQLEVVADDVRGLSDGTAVLPPVTGLATMLRAHRIPDEPLLDLVEANRIDQRVASYETFADLLGYCRYSAAPVGRLVLHRAHAATEESVAASDDVCNALQVLEHCQDVGEDANADRVYLPAADLRRAGVAVEDLCGNVTSPELRRVVAIQVARARTLLESGHGLVRRLRGWARVAVAGYVAGGLATADALQAAEFRVLEGLIEPSNVRTAWHAARLVTRPERSERPRGER